MPILVDYHLDAGQQSPHRVILILAYKAVPILTDFYDRGEILSLPYFSK